MAELGDLAGAIEAHEAALARNPSLAQAHANLISLYGRTGQWAKAEAHYKAVLASATTWTRRTTTTACCSACSSAGRRRPPPFALAIAANPLHAQARNNLGQILEGERKLAEATDAVPAGSRRRPATAAGALQSRPHAARRAADEEAAAEFEKLREPQDAESPRYLYAPGRGQRAGRPARAGRRAGAARRGGCRALRPARAGRGHRPRPGGAQMRAAAYWPLHVRGGSRRRVRVSQRRCRARRRAASSRRVAVAGRADVLTHRRRDRPVLRRRSHGRRRALVDYDNDGDLDVYLLQNQRSTRARPARRPHAPAVSQRARRAQGRCASPTSPRAAALGGTSYGMGVATGDYDNDGDTDLYVTALGPNTLYRNNGDGTFTDVTAAAGVDDARWSTAAAFVDYDRDGDLDLFVANYLDFSRDREQAVLRSGRRARLLRAAVVPARARSAVPQRRQRALHRRLRGRRHHEGRRRGARRLDRRLQRRRLARSVRRQRRDAEPALDQPEGRHVRRRWPAGRRRR